MLRRLFIVGCLFGSLLGAAPAGAAPTTPLPACTGDPATNPPCVVQVLKNGIAFPYDDSDGPSDWAWAHRWNDGGTHWFNFNIYAPPPAGPFTLNPADRYSITINTKNVVPGETFARGNDVKVQRSLDGAGHHLVTFEQNPVRTADDSCTGAGVCTMTATRTSPGYLDGWIDDLDYITDPDDAAAMKGFDLASNIDWVSSPLELDYVTNSIFLRVNNAHFESDGTTVFQGLAEFKLPFSMLRRLYHVDDPASLTAAAFSVTGAGGSATTTVDVDPGGETVRVDIDGITFSKKTLRITGDMRPTRPQNVRSKRLSPYRGRIAFDPAQSRGSRVREYKAYCSRGDFFSWRAEADSPIIVTGLRPGLRYDCTVRARSRAGWSRAARITMPGHVGATD